MLEGGLTEVAARGREIAPALLWSAALIVGVGYAARSARRAGLDGREAYWAAVCAVARGLIGGRLLAAVLYGGGRSDGAGLLAGGRTFYGGLLAGAVGFFAYLRARRLPSLAYADAAAPACALAYGVGRIGCFFNGDDYGIPARGLLAVRFGPGTDAYADQLRRGLIPAGARWAEPVLATPLLHAALGFALFLLLRRSWGRPGARLGVFALAYGAGRFGLEALRGDVISLLGPLSVHQGLSVLLVGAGGLLIVRGRRAAPQLVPAE